MIGFWGVIGTLSRSTILRSGLLLASAWENAESTLHVTAPEVFLYDDISVDSCLTLQKELRENGVLSRTIQQQLKLETYPPISLHIQSDGGTLSSALNVCDFIESFDVPIHTHVEGLVASAASLISVCGDYRYMTKRSTMLIHQPSAEASGSVAFIQDEAHNMRLMYDLMIDIYVEHSKLKKNDVIRMIENEKYLNASDCLRFGLIDEIV
tara:strand:+ start:650 stop:1279 length:630 start_codon:yes stop_codon:yes gene_type:complete